MFCEGGYIPEYSKYWSGIGDDLSTLQLISGLSEATLNYLEGQQIFLLSKNVNVFWSIDYLG
jgi:hypothetical protein